MKVRFLLPVAKDRSGNTWPKYPEDFYDRNEVADLPDDLAQQFVGEGQAVVVTEPEKPTE